MEQDIRWLQRFSNYAKALTKLTEAVQFIDEQKDEQNNGDTVLLEISQEGLIQRFEYTHELAWKVMKDYAEYQGNNTIGGSRDAIREALQLRLISNGGVWMDMIKGRNEASRTYNNEISEIIVKKIVANYYPEFLCFKKIMDEKAVSMFGLKDTDMSKIQTAGLV
jgi:nucleotidyltransferase substrate binding protein (TIGR01987 family)